MAIVLMSRLPHTPLGSGNARLYSVYLQLTPEEAEVMQRPPFASSTDLAATFTTTDFAPKQIRYDKANRQMGIDYMGTAQSGSAIDMGDLCRLAVEHVLSQH